MRTIKEQSRGLKDNGFPPDYAGDELHDILFDVYCLGFDKNWLCSIVWSWTHGFVSAS